MEYKFTNSKGETADSIVEVLECFVGKGLSTGGLRGTTLIEGITEKEPNTYVITMCGVSGTLTFTELNQWRNNVTEEMVGLDAYKVKNF